MKLAQKSHCGSEEIYYRNKSDYPDMSLALGSECWSWDVFHRGYRRVDVDSSESMTRKLPGLYSPLFYYQLKTILTVFCCVQSHADKL